MVSARNIGRGLLAVVMAAAIFLPVINPAYAVAADDQARKVKNRVEPIYPDLAKRMNLSGMVKIEVVVNTGGTAKSMKPLGGNPVLIEAATEALKKWRWDTGPETTEIIMFRFNMEH